MEDYKQNFLWHIEHSQMIKCKLDKLWETISSESNLELFHPFCNKNQVTIWPGNQSQDRLVYLNGRTMTRNFVFWKENHGYDLFINEDGVDPSFVSWRIKQVSKNSLITISISPYLFNKGNKIFNWFPFRVLIRPSLEKYLYSVLGGLKYYLENGKKVEKNQFGVHPWFSL
tara:strand:- start:1891 stop:2403 length:513 start_codon:yes stop_codon:yes gene_type:complete